MDRAELGSSRLREDVFVGLSDSVEQYSVLGDVTLLVR